jgi:hypothetical protein
MDAMERGVISLKKINFGILYLTLLLNTSTTDQIQRTRSTRFVDK